MSCRQDLACSQLVRPGYRRRLRTESSSAHRDKIIQIVTKRTRLGAIVLSHDYAQPDTIAAYRTLLPWLDKRFDLVALN